MASYIKGMASFLKFNVTTFDKKTLNMNCFKFPQMVT